MSNYSAQLLQDAQQKLVLYRGVTRDGKAFFAYIRCNEKQYFKMKQDFAARKPCQNASDYGKVIYTDYGTEPDENAQSFLNDYLAAV